MPYVNHTYRITDGERIEGSWRPIFIKNGNTYFLSALKVYADGIIDCWDLVDFPTFQQKVTSGWVATTLPQSAQASALHLGSWRFDRPSSTLTPQLLIAEVADEIEHLAGRPTSSERCRTALDHYLDERSEANLAALRDAYFAVPEHLRIYLLGDMDAHDIPLRMLLTPVGEFLERGYTLAGDEPVQPSDHEDALNYFRQRCEEKRKREVTPPPWEDDVITSSPSVVRFDQHSGGGILTCPTTIPLPSWLTSRAIPRLSTLIGLWPPAILKPASGSSPLQARTRPARWVRPRDIVPTGTLCA
jgi:hypothetical protein